MPANNRVAEKSIVLRREILDFIGTEEVGTTTMLYRFRMQEDKFRHHIRNLILEGYLERTKLLNKVCYYKKIKFNLYMPTKVVTLKPLPTDAEDLQEVMEAQKLELIQVGDSIYTKRVNTSNTRHITGWTTNRGVRFGSTLGDNYV